MREKMKQVASVINTLEKVVVLMKNGQLPTEAVNDVLLTIAEINSALYDIGTLKFQKNYNMEDAEEYMAFVEELERLIQIWRQTLERRRGKQLDVEFWSIYEYFKYVDVEKIYETVVRHFLMLPDALKFEYLSLLSRYTFLQYKIDFTKGDFSLIRQHVEMLVEEVEKYRWLYGHLADNRSKAVLNGIVRYWFEFDLNRLRALCETLFADYYDLDILECGAEDVMVDLGAYIGDSALEFANTYRDFKRIYAYEITSDTYQRLVNNVKSFPNIIPVNKGVGKENGVMYLDGAVSHAGNKLLDVGNQGIEVVTLDEDISEPIGIIKMDIEGAEKDAILGAKYHIQQEKPKLLISAYHCPSDIFEIPELIYNMRDDYKFYIRYNGHGSIWPCDYVLFAV